MPKSAVQRFFDTAAVSVHVAPIKTAVRRVLSRLEPTILAGFRRMVSAAIAMWPKRLFRTFFDTNLTALEPSLCLS